MTNGQIIKRLQRLEIGQGYKAQQMPVTPAMVSAYYRLAKKAGIKPTVRILPDGLWVYRKA